MTPDLYHGGQIHRTDVSPTSPPLDVVGIDWLRLTGLYPDWLDKADTLIREVCPGHAENLGGMHGYRGSTKWPNGVRLFHGHETSGGMLEIPGGACVTLGVDVLRHLGNQLLLGGRCTRIDIARDLKAAEGERLTLIDDVLASCKRGELCGAKGYQVFDHRDATTQDIMGQGIYLGSKQSPRFVRLYDKGLEQGTSGPGQWVRWEAQLREDHANQAGVALLAGEEFPRTALGIAHGFIDFRENTGDPNLERRPRMAFYQRLIATIDLVRTRASESTPDFDRWWAWMRSSVGPMIAAISKETGLPVAAIAAQLLADVHPSDNATRSPVLLQAADFFRQVETRFPLTA